MCRDRSSRIGVSRPPLRWKRLTFNSPKAQAPLFHQTDLRNASEIESVFESYKAKGGIWGVVHLAALKAVGESSERPLDYYQVNVSGSVSLLQVCHLLCDVRKSLVQAMQKYGTNRIVFSSSATVYGTPPTIPIPEHSPVQPESVYGRTKSIVEQIIQDTCRGTFEKEGALKAVSVRYFK